MASACPTTATRVGTCRRRMTSLMCGEAYRTSRRDRRGDGALRSATAEPQALPRSDRHAPGRADADPPAACPTDLLRPRASRGPRRSSWAEARLQERPGHGARADRHDRVHDGLRHDRRRAGHRAGQVQEAGRRWLPQDREQHGPDGAREARLHRGRVDGIVAYIDEQETIEGAPG